MSPATVRGTLGTLPGMGPLPTPAAARTHVPARSRWRMATALGLVSLALLLNGCAGARNPIPSVPDQASGTLAPAAAASLDEALAEGLRLAGASGAIAGVWVPGVGRWLASPGRVGTQLEAGTGRPTGGAAVNAGMQFRVGTLTTAMTCTVLLRLVDEGRVGLDDPVSTYLSRPPGLEGITLRQLCQHTSGLGQPALDPQFIANPTRQWAPMELISGGLGSVRAGQPGREWNRSDVGIQLLGQALQAATGEQWPDLYRRYIFDPLGLESTAYPGPADLEPALDHPHGWAAAAGRDGAPDCAAVQDVTLLSTSMTGVAGGVVSTLEDLRTWSLALATGSLLEQHTAGEQWKTVPEDGTSRWRRQGLGVEQVGPLRGGAGMIPGFLSATLTDPVSGLVVVVTVNNSSGGEEFILALARWLAVLAADAQADAQADGSQPVESTRAAVRLPWTAREAETDLRSAAVCPAGAADQAAPAG